MITISLCLIVKDEQRTLARCLDSLNALMDEIIIVDTGSVDETKEIAAMYTDNIFDYPWQDDFSAARNFCISKATKEYIYMADADEILDKENQHKFMQLKQTLLHEIDIVQMLYCNQLEFGSVYNFDEEYRPKLFKRIREFRYIDPIHETLQVDPIIYDSEIRVLHRPHESHAKRDFMYFQKAIARGVVLSKRILNMYAKELFIAGGTEDFIQAKEFFKGVMISPNRGVEEVLDAALVLAHIYRLEQNFSEFMKYALKMVSMSTCAEICYELGEYYVSICDYYEAIIWFYNAAYETECRFSLRYAGELILERLADCYDAVGDEENALEYRKLASASVEKMS